MGRNHGWAVAISTKPGKAEQVAAAGEIVMSVAATASGQVAFGLLGNGLGLTDFGFGDPQAIAWHKPLVALHAPPLITNAGNTLIALDSDGQMASSVEGGAVWLELERPPAEEIFAIDTVAT